ncbi:uncharacterized protein [Castor canadensis]|uniref:Uncharacterized protein n=1 Tax=Castor canadensis TaxID=51338 RepID=A0AC58JX16_CASCN
MAWDAMYSHFQSECSPQATEIVHVDVHGARDSAEPTSPLNFCDPVREQKVSLDEQDRPVALPGPSPRGEESPPVTDMTHVNGTNSRDSAETIRAPPLLGCNQDAKVSLEEQDLSITLPGPSPTGECSPQATEIVHVDVPDARDSAESTSPLNFCDPVREQKVSLDEQDRPVALPGPSPRGEESPPVTDMTHVNGTNSRDSAETIRAPPLLGCNQDAKVSLEEQDLSITLPGPSPTGECSPQATEIVHVDVPDARDSAESTSPLNFCDPVREQKVSLDEQDRPVALPGPSPRGTP